MKIRGMTDVGKIRNANQDSFDYGELSGGAAFAVVCDGMGGARGGAVASSTAVKAISEAVREGFAGCDGGASELSGLLNDAVSKANAGVYDYALEHEELRGMGTTVVAVLVCGQNAVVANAGDSRAYHICKDGIVQITRDHSIVQDMVENGSLTPDEAATHPKKNIITRALGVEKHLDIDFFETSFMPGEALLLCTDGLTNHVDMATIERVFRECGEQSPDELIRLANNAGGSDNITVVVMIG